MKLNEIELATPIMVVCLLLACILLTELLPVTKGQQVLPLSSSYNGSLSLELEPEPDLVDRCPPWMRPNETRGGGGCKCRLTRGKDIAKCRTHDSSLLLQACYCLSFYPDLNATVYGNCLYTCSRGHYQIIAYGQETECSRWNRTGELCSKCTNNGTGFPLYSYSLNCIQCTTDTALAVLEYVLAAYLPLTAFFVFVVAFRISATSERLSGYILMSQIIASPAQMRYISSLSPNSRSGYVAIEIALAIHAVWNLDFFRGLYRPFCLSDSTSILNVVSLEYLIALYPLCLIFVTYLVVRIYDRFAIVAQIWSPVHRIFNCMRRKWNARRSLVDAFATFLLLSYIKILNASFDLLVPTTLHNMTGDALPVNYLYTDASTRVFHGRHIKYGILAIAMLLVFNLLPLLLLLLYPFKCFQALLNRLHCCNSSWLQALHIFMDSFLGSYRTTPRDYRHFAALGLLVRIANLLLFTLTQSRYYYPFGCALFVFMAGLIVVAKPYKSPAQNSIDAALYLVFAFGYLGATAYALSPYHTYNAQFLAFMAISSAMSILYLAGLVLHSTVLKLLPLSACTLCAETRSADTDHAHNMDEELFQSFKERNESSPLLRPHVEPAKEE